MALLSLTKRVVRRAVPPQTMYVGRRLFSRIAARRAREAFERATAEPVWLGPEMLERLMVHYPRAPTYTPGPQAISLRGQLRARDLWRLVDGDRAQTLEVGAKDAMVSRHLVARGRTPRPWISPPTGSTGGRVRQE